MPFHYQSLWRDVERLARAVAPSLRMLGITSSRRGEGASTIAVQLAAAAARDGDRRVLLVDSDFARPSVQRVFGLPLEPGWADVLREGEACEAYVRATPRADLFVLPAGALNDKPSRAFDALELGVAVKEFAVDFDLVVFDMPPAGETSFALRLAGLLDAVLLVVEADLIPAEVVRRTSELLKRAGMSVGGCLEQIRGGRRPRRQIGL